MTFDAVKINLNSINTWRFTSILLVVVLIFAMRECHISEISVGDNYIKLDQYKKEAMAYNKTINKLGQEVTYQEAVLIDKNKVIEKQILENSNLSKLNRQIKLQTVASKSNFTAGYENAEVHEIHTSDTIYEFIPVGTNFSHSEEWFALSGRVGGDGIEFDSVQFNNSLTLTLGYGKRKGLKELFKEKPLIIEGVNSNPYMSTVGMQNIAFKKPKKKWYETRAFAFGVGVVAGIAIMR